MTAWQPRVATVLAGSLREGSVASSVSSPGILYGRPWVGTAGNDFHAAVVGVVVTVGCSPITPPLGYMSTCRTPLFLHTSCLVPLMLLRMAPKKAIVEAFGIIIKRGRGRPRKHGRSGGRSGGSGGVAAPMEEDGGVCLLLGRILPPVASGRISPFLSSC